MDCENSFPRPCRNEKLACPAPGGSAMFMLHLSGSWSFPRSITVKKWQSKWSCMAADSCDDGHASERSSAWLEHLLWEQDVAGSNPVAPTISISPCWSNLFTGLFTDSSSTRTLAKILLPEQKVTGISNRSASRHFFYFLGNPLQIHGFE